MPNRILRDGILRSAQVARLGWAEEVFYRRLHSVVDDFGTYYADPGLLRADCYPRQISKVSDSDIEKWLRACVDAALVRVYPASDGERYLQVLKFRQQVRATKSKFPQPPSECAADATQPLGTGTAVAHLDVFGDVDVDVTPQPPKGAAVEPEGFKAFWQAWPKSTRKGGRDKCLSVWAEKRYESQVVHILAHVAAMSASKDWTKEGGQFIPAPVVYLRSTAWTGAELPEPAMAHGGAI